MGDRSDRLRRVRAILGLSQHGLAELLNVRQATVSSWETGRTDVPVGQLRLLADLLDPPHHAFQWLKDGGPEPYLRRASEERPTSKVIEETPRERPQAEVQVSLPVPPRVTEGDLATVEGRAQARRMLMEWVSEIGGLERPVPGSTEVAMAFVSFFTAAVAAIEELESPTSFNEKQA